MAAALAGAVAVVLSRAVIDIPKPGGPHPVGYRNRTLAVPGRSMTVRGTTSPRVLMLDIWYPASSVAGFAPEPYEDKHLARQLSKVQGIPEIGDSAPSYTDAGAPALAGRSPAVNLNPGNTSYPPQNSSTTHALASSLHCVTSTVKSDNML